MNLPCDFQQYTYVDSREEIRFEMYVIRYSSVEDSPNIQQSKIVSRENVGGKGL